jgi:N-acetylmuramoyl-L-alanine amidase
MNRLVFLVLMFLNCAAQAATVIAAGVLPVSDYTRITIESDLAIAHSMLILKNPDRVVLDLKNVPINQSLKALTSKVLPDDFYIKKVRVANFKQGVTRMVVDLKAEAKPKLSVYKPAGDYQYRLALDIYPAQNDLATSDENVATEAPKLEAPSAKSSGAKIVLDIKPALELEDAADTSVDAY